MSLTEALIVYFDRRTQLTEKITILKEKTEAEEERIARECGWHHQLNGCNLSKLRR